MKDSDKENNIERWNLLIKQLKEVGADVGKLPSVNIFTNNTIIWFDGSNIVVKIYIDAFKTPRYRFSNHLGDAKFAKCFEELPTKYKEVLVFYLDLFNSENDLSDVK